MIIPISRSARLYQERRLPGDQETLRSPGPRGNLDQLMIHSLTLSPPYPAPAVLQETAAPPPDAGHTQPWPHGAAEEAAS